MAHDLFYLVLKEISYLKLHIIYQVEIFEQLEGSTFKGRLSVQPLDIMFECGVVTYVEQTIVKGCWSNYHLTS